MPHPDGTPTAWELAQERHLNEKKMAKKPTPVPQILTEDDDEPPIVLPSRRVSLKSEMHMLDYPFFSLSKTPDREPRVYTFPEGQVKIFPSSFGMATIWDRDILLYLNGHLAYRLDQVRPVSLHNSKKMRTFQFTIADYMNATRRSGGNRYRLLQESLNRLLGTIVQTDLATNGLRNESGFNLIANYSILGKTDETDLSKIMVEVTISSWSYNAVWAREILTLSNEYFSITSSLKRRLYELARKNCGSFPQWKIGLEHLQNRVGSTAPLRNFRLALKKAASENDLPQYGLRLDTVSDVVLFYAKTSKASTTSVC